MSAEPNIASTRWPHGAIIALLVAAAVIPFIKTLGFGFVMDEIPAIRSNPLVHGWESLIDVWTHGYGSPDQPFEGLYRPVTIFLFAIVWNATGGWPIWFHLLAIALHAGATVLVWRLLLRGVGRTSALLAALWFAVHPLHVETVANVANSSETLVAMWTCALALYLLRLDQEGTSVTPTQAVTAGALCLAAVLSKESGAMAPILALLCVWGWRSSGVRAQQAWKGWTPVLAAFGLAAVVVVVLRALVLGGPVTGESIAVPGIDDMSTPRRILSMLSLAPRILGLLFWTAELNPAYGPSEFAHASSWLAVGSIAVVLAACAGGVWLARRADRRMLVALLWIFIAFLPASNLLVATGQILAERTLYVPSIGVAMLLALALSAVRKMAPASPAWLWSWRAAIAVILIATAVSAVRTLRFTEVWRSHEAVHAQIIAADPANYRGYWYTAVYLGNNGQMDEAFPLVERAFRMYPADRGLRLDYGDALLRRRQPGRAVAVLTQLMNSPAYRARPRAVAGYLDALGRTYGPDSVVAAGRRIMTQTPSRTAALYLGAAHEVRGETDMAAQVYRDGLRVEPTDSLLAARLQALLSAP